MKFKVDENLPVDARDDLRAAGHDAVTVADQQLAGRPDVQVASVCRGELIALMATEPLPGNLWIVDDSRIRIRAGTHRARNAFAGGDVGARRHVATVRRSTCHCGRYARDSRDGAA